MVDATGLPALPTSAASRSSSGRDAAKIHDAARQFEALLIGELLKTARAAAGSGWMTSGEDQAGVPILEMAEQQFAQAIASSGGLGLAAMIVAGLDRSASENGPKPQR